MKALLQRLKRVRFRIAYARRAMKALLQRLKHVRFRIAHQLYLGLGGAVSLTVFASLIAWVSFDTVGDAQDRVNEGAVPEMATAFGIAQQSGTLVAASPRLTAAATPAELERVSAEIATEREAFRELLDSLAESGDEEEVEQFRQMRALGQELIASIDAVEASVAEQFALVERNEALRVETEEMQAALEEALVPAIDDQFFYAMTGFRDRKQAAAPREVHLREEELNQYRLLTALQEDATTATQIVANTFNLSEAPLLVPLRERFEATIGRIDRHLEVLGQTPVAQQIGPLFARLAVTCIADEGIFDLRQQEFALAERQTSLFARNQDLAVDLVAEVEGLVRTARESAVAATAASASAIRFGRLTLLFLNAIGIGGAVLIAWLFVGRILLRRLALLSDWMREMAEGNLEAKIEIGGHDEVADMAAALEVFRQRSLEARRLNLVEQLAEELRGKNDELESVLGDLRRAQDQIVTREKLAALGELTAGVAHEIKNPLNFVKNFSEVSSELLEELIEVLEQAKAKMEGEQQEEVDDICADLAENLKCISEHGERANRIVHDMLMMGRDSGERSEIEINKLVKDNALLAYHSARATDSNFRLEIEEDFDEQAGRIEVVGQEIGRVVLNMVSNACQATDTRRRKALAAGDGAAAYEPILRLTTQRENASIKIKIRDNGSGMPPDVVEKIFNPFFTTKPANQGTGLGLSMSNDIVRKHGGTIRVESEVGKGTEMVVHLPTKPGAEEAGSAPAE